MLAMMALVGIGSATPFAPGSVTVTEVYTNSCSVQATEAVMREVCERVPAETTMVQVVMGEVHDLFRPRRGRNWCEMLLSNNDHEFYNGTMWVLPRHYYQYQLFGGSADE